jgi:predicted transport protein
MPLFKIDNQNALKVTPQEFNNEQELQILVDNNLETMIGVRKIESQYPIPNGRIDTLGIDDRNIPIVIEYKWAHDSGAIVQALFYLDWIKQNKRSFEMLVREKIGQKIKVDWNSPPRVIIIAKDFDLQELSAVNQIVPVVELKRYQFFGDLLTIDDATPLKVPKKVVQLQENIETEEPETPTLENTLKPLSPAIREVFGQLRDRILALGDDIREFPGQWWVDYRKSSTFVSPNIRKQKLTILIKMGDQKIDDPKSITRHINYYGRLNTSFDLNSLDQLDYAMHLIKQAYDYVP